MTASHLNGDNQDNRLTNLMYETPKDNSARKVEHGTLNTGDRNGSAKLTWYDVIKIRASAHLYSYRELGDIYGVSRSTIGRVVRNECWNERRIAQISDD